MKGRRTEKFPQLYAYFCRVWDCWKMSPVGSKESIFLLTAVAEPDGTAVGFLVRPPPPAITYWKSLKSLCEEPEDLLPKLVQGFSKIYQCDDALVITP